MNDIVSALINDKMQQQGLSLRQASMQIGITHTTLRRIIDGKAYDVPTAKKVSKWLGINTSTLLDIPADLDDEAALAQQIAAVLNAEPTLKNVFREAVKRVQTGEMKPQTLKEIASYAAYRLSLGEQTVDRIEVHSPTQADRRSGQ